MARQLDPPPIAFSDRSRAKDRSPFALYQVINQGLEGTAMQSFAQLPDADKWALAYQASRFAYPDDLARQGKSIWQSDAAVRSAIPDLNALSSMSESQLAGKIGAEKAGAVIAYLRSDPAAVGAKGSSLDLARERLNESVAAYRAGNRDEAKRLALAAYLDGFEPVEPMLGARSRGFLRTSRRRWASCGRASRPIAIHRRSRPKSPRSSRCSTRRSPHCRRIRRVAPRPSSAPSRSSCAKASKRS